LGFPWWAIQGGFFKQEEEKMKMECNIRLVEFGTVKALVSVLYGDLELRGFKVVDQKGGDPWVAMPSREYMKDGERQFVNVVWVPDTQKKKAFTDAILKAYKRAMIENPSEGFESRSL
jgi:DNA-binding cell septation regulator SpoVG